MPTCNFHELAKKRGPVAFCSSVQIITPSTFKPQDKFLNLDGAMVCTLPQGGEISS
jgi:hypothetical protein